MHSYILVYVLSLVFSVVLMCIFTPLMIPVLRKLKFGQQIIEDYGPTWHQKKQNTPTMGGILFIAVTVLVYLLFSFSFYTKVESGLISDGLITVITSVLFAMIGFSDDYTKIKMKHNQGLTESQKLVFQFLVSVGFVVFTAVKNGGNTAVDVPFTSVSLDLSYFYYPIAVLLLVGFTNSVNIVDGLDGLCTSTSIPVCLFIFIYSLYIGATEIAILSACFGGALIGFLVFNWHPAKIMMGDTGSMFIGGMLICMTFSLGKPLLIILIGLVYIIDMLTVAIQRTYFKLTHGKRLFKMTPIHHAFELDGFKEETITIGFAIASLVCCVLAGLWLFL